eukprot:6641249-Prymnesium_polylepis.1
MTSVPTSRVPPASRYTARAFSTAACCSAASAAKKRSASASMALGIGSVPLRPWLSNARAAYLFM